MAKTSLEIEALLAGPRKAYPPSSSSSSSSSAYADSKSKYVPPYRAEPLDDVDEEIYVPGTNLSPQQAAILKGKHRNFKSVFIDTLTTKDDHGNDIPGAAEKVEAMRQMRFHPEVLYAAQNHTDANLRANDQATYYTQNGVRFLKPMANPNTIDFRNFSETSRVQVIDNRSWWSSFTRGISMVFQTVFTAGLGAIRLFSKMKQILPGNFGYAMNMNGDIEIYPASASRRIGLSPWTNIEVASITQPYVNIFNRIHLVNVPEGKYAMAKKDRFPVFLPPGRHLIESIDFKLDMDGNNPKFVDKNSPLIQNGDSYIIRVPKGKVAFADLIGQPQILEPEHGEYVFHDPNFKLAKASNSQSNPPVDPFEDIGSTMVNANGAVRVVTVNQTHALISNEGGHLHIHRGGRHPLVNANHVCEYNKPTHNFDLTQQKMLITDNNEVFISKDGVQLQVKSEMLFKVRDVEKCIKNVGVDDYRANIKARAQHIIRELIKANNYLNTGDLHGDSGPAPSSSEKPSASKEIVPRDPQASEQQLLLTIAKTLRKRLKEDLEAEGGIELHDVLITNLLPLSENLRKSIEANANSIAEAQRKITEAELEQNINKTKAETAKTTALIDAEKNARVLEINTQASADAQKIGRMGLAEAEAEALKIKNQAELTVIKNTAETQAAATITTADAEKHAHVLRAQGLAAYNGMGAQLQLLQAQGAAAKGMLSNANVNLVAPDIGAVATMFLNSFVQKPAPRDITPKANTAATANGINGVHVENSENGINGVQDENSDPNSNNRLTVN